MIKIAVCNDEAVLLEELKHRIGMAFDKVGVVCEIHGFTSGEAVLKDAGVRSFDLVFLDTELKTMSGIDVARRLRTFGYSNHIVFIASFVNYAIEGYKVGAFRYILKDSLANELTKCVESFCKQQGLERFQFGNYSGRIRDFLYAESNNHKVVLYLNDGTDHTFYTTLNYFEDACKSGLLLRVHKSYLVNVRYVKKIRCYKLVMENEVEIPIPKARYAEVKRNFRCLGYGYRFCSI